MPTYHARGVSAHLGILPLAEAITPKVVLRKGDLAKQQCEKAEKKLMGSKLLAEEPVTFPGDKAGFELNWLGHAPFMQCVVGSSSSQMHGHQPGGLRQHSDLCGDNADGVDSHCKPEALVLHVNLSYKTFNSGLSINRTHLKIEVLFNGQLTSCLFVPFHDVRSRAKPLHQVFAGTRVDYLAERPWVILPGGVTADGSAKDTGLASSVEQRWEQLSETLQQEASERGRNDDGNISPSAEYLQALAAMPMPKQVSSMQKSGCKSFGVIDLVISAGDGRKVTSGKGYLKAPQRLVDENFPLSTKADNVSQQPGTTHATLDGDESAAERTRAIVEVEPETPYAEYECDLEYEPSAKRRAIASQPSSQVTAPAISNPLEDVRIPSIPHPTLSTLGHPLSSATMQPQSEVSSSPDQNGSRTRSDCPPERVRIQDPKEHADEEAEWSLQMFSDPLFGQSSSNGCMRATTHVDMALSSPGHRPPMDINSSTQEPNLCFSMRSEDERRPSFKRGYWSSNAPTSVVNIGRLAPTGLSGQTCFSTAPVSSQNLPHAFPYAPNLFGYHSGISPDRMSHLQSLALPPTAMFTVPTKPKRGMSHTKAKKLSDLTSIQHTIFVTRLLITGRGGVTVVDYHWLKAQRVPQKKSCEHRNRHDLTNNPFGTTSHKSAIEHGVREPHLWIDEDACQDDRDLSTQSLMGDNSEYAQPTPQSWSKPKSHIRGVQGPKAAPFIFEDPEMLMRESARSQRLRSPIKRKYESESPRSHTSVFTVGTSILPEMMTSSPLSSAPNTPEPCFAPHVIPDHAIRTILTGTEALPTQMDGSAEIKIDPVQTPFPSKSASGATQKLHMPAQSTKKLSARTKKRKKATLYLPKLPRSPNRLLTTNNPPLNRDCVIAYAESEDKHTTTGVLRQVRGERQGIFQEEYVVFATRFFIPGI